MKFGVNTYIWSADFTPAHLDLLPTLKAHGFDGVEIPIFRPAQFEAGAIRRGAEAAGLERTAVASPEAKPEDIAFDGVRFLTDRARSVR